MMTEEGVAADGTMGDYISTITGSAEKGYTVVNHAKPEPEIIKETVTEKVTEKVTEQVTETVTVTVGGGGPVPTPAPTKSVTVKKVWDDDNNEYGKRPPRLSVTLMRNGEAVATYELNEGNKWSKTADGLEKLDELNQEITYSWTEPSVEDYTSTKEVTGDVTIFTNRYRLVATATPTPVTSSTVTKVWDDDNDAYQTRPESLTVTLSNGTTTTDYTLNAANKWTVTVDDLPAVDEAGNPITYTWTEKNPNGYTPVTEKMGNLTVLTNRYRPAPTPTPAPRTVTAGVTKVWDDNNNEYRLRPANLTVYLNGTPYVLNAGNGWTLTLDDLPAEDENGNEITYTWTEETLANYTLERTAVMGNMTVFTNRYRPAPTPTPEPVIPTTEASVVKIWDDDNNEYGVRPANIRVTLSNGQSFTLNAENNWSVTVENLPAEDAEGNPITYTWTEQSIPGYTLVSTVVAGKTTVFTNRYRPLALPPTDGKKIPGKPSIILNDYMTPLGIGVTINHVGDCFE